MQIHCKFDELVSPLSLRAHPKNANNHPPEQIKRLSKILEYQGWRYPIKVSKRSGYVTSGHGRIQAALLLGWNEVPVNYQDYEDDDQEQADVHSDNAIASWAELDLKLINAQMGDFDPGFDIDLLGIKDFTLDVAEKEFGSGEDEVPETPPEPVVKRGELWILGEHRLLIDDCTVKENVERLMAGEKADMVFTDPPYGIGYEYNAHDDSSAEENLQMVAAALCAQDCGRVWTPGLMNLPRDISRFGKTKVAVWYKKFAQAGNGIGGASTWEPILIQNPTNKSLPNDVLVVSTEREILNGKSLRELHSCPKPVNLYEQLISSLSNVRENIFEPFCGSGTTLIACEKTNRKCFGMEIDPHYGQVIIERYIKFTGRNDVYRLEANGHKTPWPEVAPKHSP